MTDVLDVQEETECMSWSATTMEKSVHTQSFCEGGLV